MGFIKGIETTLGMDRNPTRQTPTKGNSLQIGNLKVMFTTGKFAHIGDHYVDQKPGQDRGLALGSFGGEGSRLGD